MFTTTNPNPSIKDLNLELRQISKNFLSYEEKSLQEAPNEFRQKLEIILSETVHDIFEGEMANILQVKREIEFLKQQMDFKQKELSKEMTIFLCDLPKLEISSESFTNEIAILKDELSQSIIDTAFSKKPSVCKKSYKKTIEPCNEEEKSFFKQRPRSANILFMEKKLREIYNDQVFPERVKDHLKDLLDQWKGLTSEEKLAFEEEAEKELIQYMDV